ncbi:ABC transporter ATP-binding protein [Virgisporangium aliadipatigenens]|uniref:ABC transporter ATP-binding protein n=1 Tax=Virgisporangium aliadipatigenens TaxID=741659 RepID=A0A8J3YJY3_9ACTN|nr:ABC transporter ATP-binding protein [Virgisporangium aliadipatigenens]
MVSRVDAVLEINGLRKTYRSAFKGPHRAVDGLDMRVEQGQIHGFLGPNGSGKTTTLRTLLGLVRPNSGRMTLLGREVPSALPEVAGHIGAIVEAPRFFGNFSGRRTLRILARAGGVRRARVEEVLELVGLRDRAGDRVKTYSLGMKQRLAVASALLKAPRLLILDEPANGLDPAGIREMRDLMRGLVEHGTTVVLSSHILGEVQQICDSVTIISRGRRVAHGAVDSVLRAQDKGEFLIRVADHERAAQTLRHAGFQITTERDHLMARGVADPAIITETLAAHKMWISELTPQRPDLESVFLQLTGTVPEPGVTRQVGESAAAFGHGAK